ncbi:hypothetical protein C0992_004359 [Termitomyces sp. T32_za158]|nr:hypothetical protein C0992_004359 [Termitomyces sp. T32_za158]
MLPPRPKYNRFTVTSAASSTSMLSNPDAFQSSYSVRIEILNGAIALYTSSAGYPIISHFLARVQTTQGGFNLGGINATGQVAEMPGNWGLIDLETPHEVYTKADYMNGEDWVLVFSDEFNTDGRTFYPGDDPYWEAVDLHYWQTNDLEWYDPSGATTKDGYLQLKLERTIPEINHNLSYKSGMIQTWNKFCFTGGLIEVNVSLPGDSTVSGLWPAIWTMGNLGRAGYGASLEGMWPYSYDSCDVGTLPNQTHPGTQTPLAAVENGDPANNDELVVLSPRPTSMSAMFSRFLTQLTSRYHSAACTCSGESHPGPVLTDGTYVGRAAPEIDVYEAIVTDQKGQVSQSAQWAPFNAQYDWINSTDNLIIPDPDNTFLNPYKGGVSTPFKFDNAYITWINDNKVAWTIMQAGLAQDTLTEIGPRPVSQEPMYIIANLGFSLNFGDIDFENIQLPATMRVDWIRVYQPVNAQNLGCDPPDFPTAAYIEAYV